MIVLTTTQRTPEWYAARVGKLTSSCAADMLAKTKAGEPRASRTNLRTRLVLERLTGVSQERDYVSREMQYGLDREADAFGLYEAVAGQLVAPAGFLAHDELPAGCSPDGIVGDYVGGVELKCCLPATHLDYLRTKRIPFEYVAQVTHQLWITGASWWDWVSFDDRFPAPLRLLRVRVTRSEIDLAAYEAAARAFLAEVDKECAEVQLMAETAGAAA